MDFSVIVPVHNRPEAIRACIRSLQGLDYPSEDYEVLVVDNGSTDETGRVAAQCGARVIHEPRPNRCRARNLGASAARGSWLAFTDSDCEADRDWLNHLAAANRELDARGEKVGILAGAIQPGEPRSTVEAYIAERGWLDQEKFLRGGRKHSPPFAATANLAVRADVFRGVGGFDPDFPAGEDADWCWRARAAGWDIHYVPEARVIHHHRAALRDMIRLAHAYGLGNADLFAKYRKQWKTRASIQPQWLIWALKGFIKSPFQFAFGRDALQRRMAWYDFLANGAQAAGRLRGAWKHKMLIL